MADLATLGLAVDSSQVKTATAELDKLSTAAVKTGVSTAALEAGAKRLGISVEEYRKRVEGAVPATEQLGAAARAQAAAWAALQPVLSGVSGQLLALSAGAGPVGVFLSALGPWGVAASVGIGALSSAFNTMIAGAEHIGDKSVQIKKFSDVTGLTVGQIKGLTSAGAALGVSSDQVTEAVERFSVGLDEAHKGTGALFDRLREINPELARQLSETRTTAQGWDILSRAIRDTTNESQRNALSRAAFGRGGLEAGLVAISSANAGGLDAQADKISKATGLTSAWVTETARLRNENIQLEKSITSMMEAAYALPVLQRQNEFLRVQKEIAAAILATGRTPEGVRVGPTGEPEMSPTPDIPDIPQAPSVGVGGENARTSNREMEARASLIQDTIRQNNLDKERIGILAGVIGQEEALALRLNELKAAMLQGKISVPDFEKASADVERMRAAAAATTVEVERAREAYGGVTRATAQTLLAGEAQLQVAESVTGAERLVTQELATQKQLRLQNVPAEEATRLAAQQREIAEANINTAIKGQILDLRDQVAVAGAVTAEEKISAQYAADKAKAIRDGVNPALAESLALEKANVAQAAEMANQQRQYAAEQQANQQRAIQGINEEAAAFARYAANRREANRQQDLWFQAHAQRGGYLGFGSEFANPDGTPKQYGIQDIQGIYQRAGQEGMNRFGQGGFDIQNQTFGTGGNAITVPNLTPNAQGLEYAITQMMLTGKSVQEAIDSLLSGRLQRNLNMPAGQPLSSDAISMIDRLMELVPESQRAATIQKEIEDAKKQPVSLAREELIKDLNDQLKQLTDATNGLTATMDPLFTGGHEALRIGYYNEGGSAGAKYYGDTSGLPTATGGPGLPTVTGGPIPPVGIVGSNYLHAATGFEGVVGGHGGTDSTPIHIMATPGEHIKLTPSGSNGASVTNIYQSINFPMSALGETRRSARQMAEGFRRAVN